MNLGNIPHLLLHPIQSKCFYDVNIGTDNINCARYLVTKLLISPHDTSDGIIVSADMPFGQHGLINITRPAVLRTYYGLDLKCISPTKIERVTYGPTSLTGVVSTDPRVYTTKPMSTLMYNLGLCLKNYVKTQFKMQHQNIRIFDCEFNHCTILTYNVHTPNVNHKLTYHCDCQYDHNGNFQYLTNSQGENTPVIVYSLGNSRTLYFRRRRVICGKKNMKRWENSKIPCHEFELNDNSIFVLHPLDEKPLIRYPLENMSQYQHGNVTVKSGNLSIALVFRNVTKTLVYDNVTLRREISETMTHHNERQLVTFDETYIECRETVTDFGKKLTDLVKLKLSNWNWM